MTDVELDERVTALEENGGGGSQNGKFTVSLNYTKLSILCNYRPHSKRMRKVMFSRASVCSHLQGVPPSG